ELGWVDGRTMAVEARWAEGRDERYNEIAADLKDKLIKIGAKVVSHGRYVVFQMAEVAIARQMFQEILRLIAELRPQPPPASLLKSPVVNLSQGAFLWTNRWRSDLCVNLHLP